MKQLNRQRNYLVVIAIMLFALLLAACGSGGDENEAGAEDMNDATHNNEEMDHNENMDDMNHEDEAMDHDQDMDNMNHNDEAMDHEESDSVQRLPNDGAVIRIVSPAPGAIFTSGEDIVVEIEVENFDLTVEEQHWHVYVDGLSWGMVMGANTDEVLRGVSAGEHEIQVYLSIPGHEELEEGDMIQIEVKE